MFVKSAVILRCRKEFEEEKSWKMRSTKLQFRKQNNLQHSSNFVETLDRKWRFFMSCLLIQSIELFCECTSSLLPQDSRIIICKWLSLGKAQREECSRRTKNILVPTLLSYSQPRGTRRSQKLGIEVGKRKLLMTALNPETRTWPTTKGIFPKLSR